MTVHIYPLDDWIEHHTESSASSCDCVCEPTIEYICPESGKWHAEPIVIHNSIDGRK